MEIEVSDKKLWWIEFLLIAAFVLMSELSIVFREYVYIRLGLNRNVVLGALWLLPVIASFLVTYFSTQRKALMGLSFILVLCVLGPLVHFFFGWLGATIDLGGLPGLKVTFQIYLILGALTIGFGTVAGVLFRK
jgi:hypothetical protein